MSRNRGKKKPKLRDYSDLVLSDEEKIALSAAASSIEQHPIVTAILGYVLVEHELDILLRRKFKRNDIVTWEELTDEKGPLRSFYAKITIGLALGIYPEKIAHDLHVVRVIRNAFAHSKKLLKFDDVLIVPELLSARSLPRRFKRELQKKSTDIIAKISFIIICFGLYISLTKIQTRALRLSNYRIRKKLAKSPLVNALAQATGLGLWQPSLAKIKGLGWGPQQLSSRLHPQPSPAAQSDDPKTEAPLGLLGEWFQTIAKTDDNEDK
jgi:DNA-binding MltR family transcriptional regulator